MIFNKSDFKLTTKKIKDHSILILQPADDAEKSLYLLGFAGHLVLIDDFPKVWSYKLFPNRKSVVEYFENLPNKIESETIISIRKYFGMRGI